MVWPNIEIMTDWQRKFTSNKKTGYSVKNNVSERIAEQSDWPMSDTVNRQQHDDADDDTEYNTDQYSNDDTCQCSPEKSAAFHFSVAQACSSKVITATVADFNALDKSAYNRKILHRIYAGFTLRQIQYNASASYIKMC